MRKGTHAGYTIIEALIVVAMVAVLTMLATPFLSGTFERRNLANVAAEAVDALREAQSAVMSGKNDSRYGVHFEGDRFVLFIGSAYDDSEDTNVVHTLVSGAEVTVVTLSPGGACTLPAGTGNCDVHFASHRGTPTETGTVVIAESGGDAKTISINAAGMIDME